MRAAMIVVIGEHHRRAAMCCSSRGSHAEGLITAPSGARLPRSTASRLRRCSALVERADDVVVPHLGRRAMFSPSVLPVTVGVPRSSSGAELPQQRRQPAGIEEILHQVAARGADVGHAPAFARDSASNRSSVSAMPGAAAPWRSDGSTALVEPPSASSGGDGVVEGGRRSGCRAAADPPTPSRRCAGRVAAAMRAWPRVGRGDRRGAGQRHAQRLGQRRSWSTRCPWSCRCRRSARCRPRCSRQSSLGDVAGAQLGPVFPDVACPSPAPCPASCRAASGPAGTKIAGRFMLVAPISSAGVVLSQPPISTTPSTGLERSSSSRLHRQEVAVHHGRGLQEDLGQRHRRHLERKSARLEHAALHVLGALLEMRVAGIDVAPGVEDGDHRLAGIILGGVAHLRRCASDGRRRACRCWHTSAHCAARRRICGATPSAFLPAVPRAVKRAESGAVNDASGRGARRWRWFRGCLRPM